jgi:site-specific DNA-methyltransferase (adenine-specific)
MEIVVEGSTLYNGDCLVIMNNMNKCSVDSIVTDPPYHLTSIVERFGKEGSAPAKFGTDGAFARASKGFMGKEWDGGDIAFQVDTWRKCLELLKPGGHLIAFSGSRTYHRMAVAIEDAGFEIRDQCIWLYGSGFPKSHKVGEGWGTALKPAHEPMVLARKPIDQKSVADNVLKHGVGGINIDDCRVQCEPDDDIVRPDRTDAQAYNFFRGGEQDRMNVRKTTRRQPRSEQNVWTDNNSGMKADMFADADPKGRFPSNVMHDGSCVVEDVFPDVSSRYFYTAKTNQAERNAGANNTHPTVKPVELMRYLVRLVTPKAGLVLDPFMGSGSTGMAAREEEFKFIGIEKEEEYYEIAKARIKNVKPQLKLFDI